jgi:predicted dehydrogenase
MRQLFLYLIRKAEKKIRAVRDMPVVPTEEVSKMKKDKYHAGVLGAGMISGAYLDNMTSRFDILQVDAIGNRSVEKAERAAEKYGIRACSIDELLADESLDIIVNLTPPPVHEEMVTRILEAGKHAYTEKCFALNTEGAERMCAMAREKGLYLGCAPDSFLCGWAQSARRVIDSGRLGVITSFAMHGNRDNDRLLGAMDYANKPGGGIILDYAVYYLTMLVSLLGPAERVSCMIKAPYPTHVNNYPLSPHYGEVIQTPNESQFYAHMELENGIAGTFSVNSDSAFFDQTYFAIYGSKGILYLGNPDWYNGEVFLYENTADFSRAFTPERIRIDNPFGFNTNARGAGVADMAYAIRDGREMRASMERAFHVLDIQECMVKSNERGSAFVKVKSTCTRPEPLKSPEEIPDWTEERSLI